MKYPTTPRYTKAAAVILVLLASLAVSTAAEAGCLQEYDDCGECARKMLWDAIWELSLGGLEDSWLYGLDCDIDMVHCLMFGHHHSYECGA